MYGSSLDEKDGQTALLSSGKRLSAPAVEVRWLALVFFQSLALLVFQVAAGYFAQSLALLADAGHSSADVVSYGINLFVERQKTVAAGQPLKRWSLGSSAAAIARIDLAGSVITTALLGVATWFAVVEAVARLGQSSDSGQDSFRSVGPALLSFALLSTLANTGTLWIYRRMSSSPSSERPEPAGLPPLELKSAQNVGGSEAPGQEDMEAAAPAAGAPAPKGGKGWRRGWLNLSANFASGSTNSASSASDDAEAGSDPWADFVCMPCTPEDGRPSGPIVAPACACSGGKGTWSATLHQIVHPGCSDAAHQGAMGGGGSDSPGSNLNLSSAMLHLVADVLRGITILVAAFIIQVGCVSDPGKTDAICALFVAAFVGLGSAALLRRVCVALWQQVRPKGATPR